MITISTFNIQNDIKKYSSDKKDIVLNYLKKNKIDILNLQEVYSKFDKDFSRELHNLHYTIFGKYRFFCHFIFNRINEKTPIVTHYPVVFSHTYHLPCLPSLLKRVMTKSIVLIDGREISVYNTHLDFQYDITKKRQLNKILKILKKDTNPIILTGDFNLKNNNIIFQKFINQLKEMNVQHVDIHEKTFKASMYHRAIDHVFLSRDFKVCSKKLITDIPTSDHYPVLVRVQLENKGGIYGREK